MKRIFDIVFAIILIIVFSFPMLIIALSVKITSKGTVLYWSDRVGKNNKIFKMPKFRTMKADTPAMATHLMKNPEQYCTTIGSFLRKTSLDELPQLYSVLKGDMCFMLIIINRKGKVRVSYYAQFSLQITMKIVAVHFPNPEMSKP